MVKRNKRQQNGQTKQEEKINNYRYQKNTIHKTEEWERRTPLKLVMK